LLRSLADRGGRGYAAGASLIAVLRREEGSIDIRCKPADLPPDRCLAPCAIA
jgi:hypothetical protein